MKYSRVYIDAFGYELPPNVVSSDDLERRLKPVYDKLHFKMGQLEALTGIRERRFWDPVHTMHDGAVKAGRKAIEASGVSVADIGMLVYGGVCRDQLEPATACAVSHHLGLMPETLIFDISNACLGVVNGIVQIANAIEIGHIQAGMVVSCESAGQIVDLTIRRLLESPDMATFKETVATLTGGSGAVAVLLTDETLSHRSHRSHRLLGGIYRSAPEFHELCRWGPDTGMPSDEYHAMATDSVGVLKNGVQLGVETFGKLREMFNLSADQPDKIICHQVGAAHQDAILDAIGVSREKDFTTYRYLGNIGTVSLPITAAVADERGFLEEGDLVGFMGIGSGLNCLLLLSEW